MDMLQQYNSTSDDDDDNKEAAAAEGSGSPAAAEGPGSPAAAEGSGSDNGAAVNTAGGGSMDGAACVTPNQRKVANLCKSEERVMWTMSPTASFGMSPGGTVYAEEDLEPLQKGKALFLNEHGNND